MEREILFRGKRVDNGEWVQGDLIHGVNHKRGKMYILPIVGGVIALGHGLDPIDGYEVIPETTGQFTGLIDKNGKRIFEGDIISGFLSKNYGRYGQQKFISFNGEIKYSFGQFYIKTGTTKEGVDRCVYFSQLWPLSPNSVEVEIIGNIHDNPSLAI